MISLGDVKFDLGANTKDLEASVQKLRSFGGAVQMMSAKTTRAAQQTAAAFRRQEQASVSALNRTLDAIQRLNRAQAPTESIDRTIAAYRRLNGVLTSGRLSALDYQRSMNVFRTEMGNIQRPLKGASVAGSNFLAAMENLSNSLVLIQGPLGGVATRVATLTILLRRGGLAVTAFVGGFAGGIYVAGRLAGSILQAGKAYNQYNSQLLAVYRDQTRANKAFEDEIEIARRTGTALQDVAGQYAKFTIAARGAGLKTEESKEIFEAFAAVASKLQLRTDQTQGVFRALEQMLSKGVIQAEELRGQLGDQLPGAFNLFAQALGVSTAELNKMLKKGEVLANETLPKAAKAAREFYNAQGEIDNYATSVNNASTAWFELRTELDKQFGVTNKAMMGWKALTNFLDTVRIHLEDIGKAIIIVSGAFIGLAAPGVIAGFVKLLLWVNRLSKGMAFLGLMTAFATGGVSVITALAAALVGAGVAAYAFGDSIKLGSSGIATLSDYAGVLINDIGTLLSDSFDRFKRWAQSLTLIPKAVAQVAVQILNSLINLINRALDNLTTTINSWVANSTAGRAVSSGLNKAGSWLGIEGAGDWLQNKLSAEAPQIPTIPDITGGKEAMTEILDAPLDMLRDGLAQAKDMWSTFYGDVEKRARQRILAAPPDFSGKGAKVDMDAGIVPSNNGGGGLSSKQLKALARKQAALNDINEAIGRAQTEIDALESGKSAAELEKLKKMLQIDKEVDRYAKSLTKAGIESTVVKNKTEELRESLRKLYQLQQDRRGSDAMTDAWASGIDAIGSALSNALATGKSVFDGLVDAAQKAAQDIFNTWFQLSITNPLKNLLFDMDEPTFGPIGGLLGGIGKLFGNSKGDVLFGGRLQNFAMGGVPNGPIMFPVAGGMGRMRENGEEGILPLARDNHGRLGVRSRGGGGGDTYVTNQIYIDGAAGDHHIKSLVTQGVTSAMQKFPNTKTFQQGVHMANRKLKAEGKGVGSR